MCLSAPRSWMAIRFRYERHWHWAFRLSRATSERDRKEQGFFSLATCQGWWKSSQKRFGKDMFEKVNRLREMSNAEISHRLRERWRQQADRWRYLCGFQQDDVEFDHLVRRHDSAKAYLGHGVLRRFYSSTQDSQAITQFLTVRFPNWMDRTLQEAIRLSAHRVNILGYTQVPLGDQIDWHRDPVSGHQWPRRYWADYDLVGYPAADAKIIHE